MCFLFHHGYLFSNNLGFAIQNIKTYFNGDSRFMEPPYQSVSDTRKLESSQTPPPPSPWGSLRPFKFSPLNSSHPSAFSTPTLTVVGRLPSFTHYCMSSRWFLGEGLPLPSHSQLLPPEGSFCFTDLRMSLSCLIS